MFYLCRHNYLVTFTRTITYRSTRWCNSLERRSTIAQRSLSFHPHRLHFKIEFLTSVRHDGLVNHVTMAKKRMWWIGVKAEGSQLHICQLSLLTTVQKLCFVQRCENTTTPTRVSITAMGEGSHFTKRKLCIQVSWIAPSISGGGGSNWNLTFRAPPPLLAGTDMNYSKWQIVCIGPVPGWSLW